MLSCLRFLQLVLLMGPPKTPVVTTLPGSCAPYGRYKNVSGWGAVRLLERVFDFHACKVHD